MFLLLLLLLCLLFFTGYFIAILTNTLLLFCASLYPSLGVVLIGGHKYSVLPLEIAQRNRNKKNLDFDDSSTGEYLVTGQVNLNIPHNSVVVDNSAVPFDISDREGDIYGFGHNGETGEQSENNYAVFVEDQTSSFKNSETYGNPPKCAELRSNTEKQSLYAEYQQLGYYNSIGDDE